MRRAWIVIGLATAAAFLACGQRRGGRSYGADNPPAGSTEAEKRILAVLDEALKAGEVWASVPLADGRMLRVLTEAAGAKNVIELGTSTGYSGLWFCLALQKTGGQLTTFDIDPGRQAMAREHFRKAGVESMVTPVLGDAHQTIARLKQPIDVLFIDADKGGYVDYLNKLLPLVRPGGLILAHNTDMAPDYVRAVTGNPALETVFYTEGGGGLGITLKKR
jgi:caffeoyl-CoA O-methyltransferase